MFGFLVFYGSPQKNVSVLPYVELFWSDPTFKDKTVCSKDVYQIKSVQIVLQSDVENQVCSRLAYYKHTEDKIRTK